MIDLSTMTDDEISRLSHSEARRAAANKGQLTAEDSKQINAIHAERARRFSAQAARERAAARENLKPRSAQQPEIKREQQVTSPSEGQSAIAEIKRIQAHAGGAPLFKVFTAEQHEARMNHILEANQLTKGESMSKPEPSPVLISEKAKDHMAQMKARGHKFYSIVQAVAHVRAEMGLSNDSLAQAPSEFRQQVSPQD